MIKSNFPNSDVPADTEALKLSSFSFHPPTANKSVLSMLAVDHSHNCVCCVCYVCGVCVCCVCVMCVLCVLCMLCVCLCVCVMCVICVMCVLCLLCVLCVCAHTHTLTPPPLTACGALRAPQALTQPQGLAQSGCPELS